VPNGELDLGSCHFIFALQRRATQLEVVGMLIEIYPSAVNATDNYYGKIPLHTACTNGATVEVIIQLLLDQFTGDEQHCSGLNIAHNHGQLPIHC
jgi:hypothetical protein